VKKPPQTGAAKCASHPRQHPQSHCDHHQILGERQEAQRHARVSLSRLAKACASAAGPCSIIAAFESG
jgi:hypothetical protein